MSQEVPWTKRWLRDHVKRHGWRGLIVAAIAGMIAAGIYQGVSAFVADQVNEGLAAVVDGGPEVSTPAPVAVGQAPLVATIAHRRSDCAEGQGGWLQPDEAAAKDRGLAALRRGEAPGPFVGWNVSFAIQGTSATAVLLTGMRVVVDERKPPIGVVLEPDHSCGSPTRSRPFSIELGPDRATVTALPGQLDIVPGAAPPAGARVEAGIEGDYYVVPPVNFPYQVSQADIEHFILSVDKIADCDCLWHVEIDWASSGQSGSFRVDNQGKPFRSTSSPTLMCRDDPAEGLRCGPGSSRG